MATGVRGGRATHGSRWTRLLLVGAAALCSLGWSDTTVRHVAWSAVDFFPPDLARQVRRLHRSYDAGIARGLKAPPSWRAGEPGSLPAALLDQAGRCVSGLREPVPLEVLVEELGVLAVRALDLNDPLAVAHDDVREPHYAAAYERYVNTILGRVRLVYYGLDRDLVYDRGLDGMLAASIHRSRELYPFVGAEFYRTGSLRSWQSFDDRSLAFGVAAVSLSRGMTDLANLAAYVWHGGGGQVPTPRPTPSGHVGPTVVVSLEGGFPERDRPRDGAPVMPETTLRIPAP